MDKASLQFFDPQDDVGIVERKLPHWSQPGTITFITWRTDDSLPKPVMDRLVAERNQWLRAHGINPIGDWRSAVARLDRKLQFEFRTNIDTRWHEELDACHGACVLRRPELAAIVRDSLLKFDSDRYFLTDSVVMPNHLHFMAAFPNEDALLSQCESWKHYTAMRLNRLLETKGRFWQQDGFDHLVRSEKQFRWLRRYIEENPLKAKLRGGEYLHFSKPL